MATVAIPAAKWSWAPPYPRVRTSASLDADTQLVERCLSGQDAAWEDLVKLHTRRVFGICYRFTNSDAEAQDLTQDVFMRVFKNLKSFRSGEGLFVVWLTRLTRNLLIDHYRRSRMERATESIEDQTKTLEETTAMLARTDGMVVGREASELLQAGLQKLSPGHRGTAVFLDLEELEYRENAEGLNLSGRTGTVRVELGPAQLGP